MSPQCYTPRASLRSALVGGLFVSADGTRRLVPDHWLFQAELLHGARLLRLSYTCCTIEVAGQFLEPIFEDASIGRLGAIHTGSGEPAPSGCLWVTGIVAMKPAENDIPLSEQELSDAYLDANSTRSPDGSSRIG